jgi:aminoglycoside 3'-phosphotransferase-1
MPASVSLPGCMRSTVEDYDWTPATDGESGGKVYRLEARGKPTLYLKCGSGKVADDITAEMVRLQWLTERVPVPEVRHFVCFSDRAFLLTTAVVGMTAYDCLLLDADRRPETVAALGRFLRMFHSLPVGECPFNSNHELRLVDARKNLESGQVDESDFDSDHNGWSGEQVWAQMLAILPMNFDRVVTHGDFSLGNILIENGSVAGCVDVGRAGAADPYQDLAILWHNLGEFGGNLQMHLFRAYGIAEPDLPKIQFHLCLDEFF